LRDPANKQTNKQTNADENITSLVGLFIDCPVTSHAPKSKSHLAPQPPPL